MATRIPWLPLSCGIAALGALRLGFTSHVDNLHSRRFSRSRRSSETQTLYFLSLVGFVRGRECATSRWAAFVCAADRCAMRPSNPSHQHIPSAAHEARLLRAAEAQRRRFCGASAALLLLWRFCQRSRSVALLPKKQKRSRSCASEEPQKRLCCASASVCAAEAALLLLWRFCFCGASAAPHDPVGRFSSAARLVRDSPGACRRTGPKLSKRLVPTRSTLVSQASARFETRIARCFGETVAQSASFLTKSKPEAGRERPQSHAATADSLIRPW